MTDADSKRRAEGEAIPPQTETSGGPGTPFAQEPMLLGGFGELRLAVLVRGSWLSAGAPAVGRPGRYSQSLRLKMR